MTTATASVMKELKIREAINAKIPVFIIYVEATIYLLLYNLYDSSFDKAETYQFYKLFIKLRHSYLCMLVSQKHVGPLL